MTTIAEQYKTLMANACVFKSQTIKNQKIKVNANGDLQIDLLIVPAKEVSELVTWLQDTFIADNKDGLDGLAQAAVING